jgi:hypothetical protein
MNIIQILFEIVVGAILIYIIWFSGILEKAINLLLKRQDKLIEKNVDHIEQITADRIEHLAKVKQFLENDIETVTNIKKRVSKSTPKKTKQTTKQRYDNRA